MSSTTGLILFLALLALPLLWGIGVYNRLVALRNAFRNAFAQIDVQLKRRYDLIPNLVETASAYMKHERDTLEAVIAARGAAIDANRRASGQITDAAALQALTQAEGVLSGALGKLFALSEAYPDLKANQTMMQLSEELTSTENRIAFARQAFNDAVMRYNVAIEQFPANLLAGLFRFLPAELLQATRSETERQPVKVSF
jgi:LemA protein